jgi:hypothetical protein
MCKSTTKYCIDQISKPLGHILNASLEHGIYPDRMRFASLRPMYETGEKAVMVNYRPISLINFFKIFEKLMYEARPQSKFPWGRLQKQNTISWKYLLQQIQQVFSYFST